jgi:hypothetical protein
MTNVEITGEPVATFEFFDLITWNVFSNKHYKSKGNIAKKFRLMGHNLATEFKLGLDMWEWDLPLVNRALVVIRVLPPKEEISDIHNVCVKHIFDGFSDAGIWADDEWAHLPLVITVWAGIDQDVQWRMAKRNAQGCAERLLKSTSYNRS